MQDKLIEHIIILALMLSNYALRPSSLSGDLKLTQNKYVCV